MNVKYFFSRAHSAWHYLRKHGIRAIIRKSQVCGLIEAFYFIRPSAEELGERSISEENTINWFIPPLDAGSGGQLNIFRFIALLEKKGFVCRIIIVGDLRAFSAARIKKEIHHWNIPIQAEVYCAENPIPPADISMATNWPTAYYVKHLKHTRHKCYFVQDFEPWFYAAGTEYTLAEQTYKFGFTGITAGKWLSDKLSQEYNMKAFPLSFSHDPTLYRPIPWHKPRPRQVFFYARPKTPRRAFELGLLVLAAVIQKLNDVKIVFAGSDVSSYNIPFAHLNAGILSVSELPALYSQCDVALILSFSNLSLLPLELMACGIPVVSNKAPYTEWLLNDDNSKLVEPTVESLAQAICELLENPQERDRIRKGGFVTTQKTSWENESDTLAAILRALENNEMPVDLT